MKTLKSLFAAAVLTLMLAGAAAADPPCIPGEVPTVPCTSAPATSDDPSATGELQTPPAPEGLDVQWVVELAIESLLLF